MKIPKVINIKKHKYIFVKKCNEDMFLYKEKKYGYNECFTKYELGLIKEMAPATKIYVNPEKVKI